MSEHNHPHDNPAPEQGHPEPQPQPTSDPATSPEGKQYSLTHMESELVRTVFRNQQANFAAILSHIAAGRLGYPVTDRTQMQLSNDAKTIILSEAPMDPNQTQSPIPTEDSGVKAAG